MGASNGAGQSLAAQKISIASRNISEVKLRAQGTLPLKYHNLYNKLAYYMEPDEMLGDQSTKCAVDHGQIMSRRMKMRKRTVVLKLV
jgi:hypothetical protein